MKVEVKDKVSEIKYPCLMIYRKFNLIVLFDEEKCGTCINKGSSNDVLGEYETTYKMELFELFDGEITLKND